MGLVPGVGQDFQIVLRALIATISREWVTCMIRLTSRLTAAASVSLLALTLTACSDSSDQTPQASADTEAGRRRFDRNRRDGGFAANHGLHRPGG
jgi:hypothetical protein